MVSESYFGWQIYLQPYIIRPRGSWVFIHAHRGDVASLIYSDGVKHLLSITMIVDGRYFMYVLYTFPPIILTLISHAYGSILRDQETLI